MMRTSTTTHIQMQLRFCTIHETILYMEALSIHYAYSISLFNLDWLCCVWYIVQLQRLRFETKLRTKSIWQKSRDSVYSKKKGFLFFSSSTSSGGGCRLLKRSNKYREMLSYTYISLMLKPQVTFICVLSNSAHPMQ